jgi:hypothetical protein
MYVPGLSCRLFSLTKFAKHGHHALVKNSATIFYFSCGAGSSSHPVTITTGSSRNTVASNITVQDDPYTLVPSMRAHDHSTRRKHISLELLQRRPAHWKCHNLLATSEHNLWADTAIHMLSETHCLSCGIATIWSTPWNKEPHSAAMKPGENAFLDIQQPIVSTGLMPATTYAYYLFAVSAFSRYSSLYDLGNKSSKAVVVALKQYAADGASTSNYEYVVSIRTYLERSQRSTQEPKRDPSGPEGTARTLQATDQRPTVRSQTPALR